MGCLVADRRVVQFTYCNDRSPSRCGPVQNEGGWVPIAAAYRPIGGITRSPQNIRNSIVAVTNTTGENKCGLREPGCTELNNAWTTGWSYQTGLRFPRIEVTPMFRRFVSPIWFGPVCLLTATIVTLSATPSSATTHVINGEPIESLSAGATAPPALVMFASFIGSGVWAVLLCGKTQRS
jgi:hypothetical protein